MNYLKELNAFRDWLLLNELTTSEIALWHALMSINNMTGWQEWFTAPNQTVQRLTGLSKQGLDNTRNGLKTKGLILYEKGKRGQSGRYKMISLVNKLVNSVDQIVDQSYDQFVDQCYDQSHDQSYAYELTINKQKHSNNLLPQQARAGEVDPVLLYQKEIGDFTDTIKDDFQDWLLGGYFDEPKLLMIEAIKEAAIHEKRSWAYVVKVLRRCLQQNIRTLEQYRQAKEEFDKAKAAKVTPIRHAKAERRPAASGEATWQDDPPKSHYGRLEV